jgi:hypothetical protein
LNLTGRIALHDAASRGTLELNDIAFSGDVRSLAGSVRGDGNFMLAGRATRFASRPVRARTETPPESISTSIPARAHCPSISMARWLSRRARRASKARSFWPFPRAQG